MEQLREVCINASKSPDRKCTCGLLRKFWRVDKHQFEQELQVTDLTSQAGADDPRPVPALPFTPTSKVHQHWRRDENFNYLEMI